MAETLKTSGAVVVELRAENVKRLKCVRITPDGPLVIVKGDNAQGKTSVLDAIAYALGGGKLLPERPLRDGARRGKVSVDLGDATVTRHFTAKSTTLEIVAKDGAKYSSPQKLLDDVVGRLSFDPLAFSKMKPAEQQRLLLDVVGVPVEEIDRRRRGVFDRRTEVNRELKRAEALQRAAGELLPNVPEEPVSVRELREELTAAHEHNQANAKVRREATAAKDAAYGFSQRTAAAAALVTELKHKLEAAERELLNAEENERDAREYADAKTAEADQLQDADVVDIEQRIDAADSINSNVRHNRDVRECRAELAELAERAEQLTRELEAIDREKFDAVASASLPVVGLGIDEDGVTFNGVPLEQASSAEQLRVAVAVGLALNPQLRVVLIRDGSLLDDASLAAVGEMAAANNAQIWVERVGNRDAVGVLIEDGEVVEQ